MRCLKIEGGTVFLHFKDNNYVVREKGPISDLRIRSRKATVSDCSCFLRPGIDICVLSSSQHANGSDQNSPNPVSGHLCCLFFISLVKPLEMHGLKGQQFNNFVVLK